MNSLRSLSSRSRTELLRTVRTPALSYKSGDATKDSAVLDPILTQSSEHRNFSTVLARDDNRVDYDEHMHNSVFHSQQIVGPNVSVKGVQLNLAQSVQANKETNTFDKILVLISHGEMRSLQDESLQSSDQCPSLSNKGIGQALDLARHIANYCNKETRLLPQLFMVAPMRGTIESALLAFPNLSPGSIHSIPWHCSSQFMGLSGDGDSTELTSQFPDIHFDLGTGLNTDSNTDGPSQFLNWLKKRNERVIVVSNNSYWHRSLIKSVIPQNLNNSFVKEGSITSIGIKFLG